jgi:hypothetical protein
MTLYSRLVIAKKSFAPVETRFRVAFEDDLDNGVKLLMADPNWLAAAMRGGVIPKLESYHNSVYRLTVQFPGEQPVSANIRGIKIKDAKMDAVAKGAIVKSMIVIGHDWHDGPRAKAMTEVQAIDYLIQKDIPNSAWGGSGNRQKFKVVAKSDLPNDRKHRNAWSL